MLQLQFTKDVLPDSVSADFQNLNKLSDQQFVSLADILFRFLIEPKETDRFMTQLNDFATENGMSPGPLRNLVKSVLLVPNGALKNNLNADQVKADLITLGLSEDKAHHFSNQMNVQSRKQNPSLCSRHICTQSKEELKFQWKAHFPLISRLAVGQTLMVNQLVDMEWKFGVTAGTSELLKVGSIFLQLKLVIRKGNSLENVYMELTLPQFYSFLHEMERAKASLECFS